MPVINYLWSKECTLVDQDHHACEHCPSWYAVQQNDYHLNSICLMATIKFIVTICKKNCNIVTWIVNYLIASIPHNNLPHNKLYVITIFNWLPPNFFLCRFCWVQAAKVVFTGWMTCSHGKCQNRKLKAQSAADPNQWPGLILSSFITRLLTRSIAPFTPAVWQNSSRKEITEYNFCLTGNLSKLLQIQHTHTQTRV